MKGWSSSNISRKSLKLTTILISMNRPNSTANTKTGISFMVTTVVLAAKDWLSTFDYPQGPGHSNFNMASNLKIYNKLTMLCHKGTAITYKYIRRAVKFDGWGAGRSLLERYHGFSKQRQRTLRNTIESLCHVHGTNICTHIDLFEKLCTQMAHNDPDNPTTEEQKIDWFLDTFTERTYESVCATCSTGTLTFNKLTKLYTHKCFSRYPQFQLSELVGRRNMSSIKKNSNSEGIVPLLQR
jgi:hypothetical protein